MPRGPRSPHVFFGRDAELAQIIHMIFTNLGSRPAHIAILGPGGYGKSTLANAVLTHERVREHFGDATYFVACESIFSSGALLIELAKTLGVFNGAPGALWSRICDALNSKDCILCFDNFESPWDQDGDIRSSIEELLSRVAETQHTTLLITMRGTARPAQTQWTSPHLPPLMTLSCDAARSIWECIANNYDESAEELTKAVDFVPLAVSLLAYLAQATSSEILLKLWKSKQTGFIYTGHANRQTNLEFSIQLSIDSSRMKANASAKELLGVLCMLPDGMHIKQVERFITILPKIDILSGICTLQECGIISVIGERYQTHPIIRNFCNNYILISQENRSALEDFYINLASTKYNKTNTNNYAELVLEVNNTKAMLSDLLKSDYQNHSKLVLTICEFIRFQCANGDFSENLIDQTIKFLQQKNASTSLIIQCLICWGRTHYYARNSEMAIVKLKEAEMLCKTSKEDMSTYYATVLNWLAAVYQLQNAFNDAEVSFRKSLEIHKLNNNVRGQADSYIGLGYAYRQLEKLNQAEASFQKAIELYMYNEYLIGSTGQGECYLGLGDTYLRLNKINEAEASYQKAIELAKLSHSSLIQGNALQSLGQVKMQRSQMQDAKLLFENALAMHKQAQDLLGQKWDQHYLDEVSFKMSQSSNLSVKY
jgi:tetratricopeptide (TPR) repeat protein